MVINRVLFFPILFCSLSLMSNMQIFNLYRIYILFPQFRILFYFFCNNKCPFIPYHTFGISTIGKKDFLNSHEMTC